MPTLILLRHAKAEPQGADDHDRALSDRGRADAPAIREWLTGQGIVVDRAVVSTSRRTRETWDLAGTWPAVYDERVYEASTDDLREVIAETGADVGVLVIVGHNPGIERLTWELDASEDARAQTDRGLPTSAVVVFDVPDWELEGARLRAVAVPRG